MDKTYKVKKVNPETVEFEIVIPADAFTKSYNTLLAQESKKVDIKGFRKGAVPKELLEVQLKPEILEQTFEKIAPIYVAQAVSTEELNIVAAPVYKDIPKLDTNKELTFKVDVTVMPEFKLGNMKKVKVEHKETKVEEKEIDAVIADLEKRDDIKAKKGTDAWAKEAGERVALDQVKTMEDFRKEIAKLLADQKHHIVHQEMESDALNQAIKLSNITIPARAIEYEAFEREHSFMHNLEERKVTLDDFLKANNLTMETMKEMWKKDAKEALEADVFLNLYAKENKIEISDEELKEEVENIKEKNKGVEYDYDNKEWQLYIKRVMLKEKAFGDLMDKVLPKH
ncbi:MAG TPA: trigger factor [Candidatus Dojkabacteria bacterium]|nr:trigger factor [Candidatus Dojkabacteria bacterium]